MQLLVLRELVGIHALRLDGHLDGLRLRVGDDFLAGKIENGAWVADGVLHRAEGIDLDVDKTGCRRHVNVLVGVVDPVVDNRDVALSRSLVLDSIEAVAVELGKRGACQECSDGCNYCFLHFFSV